MFYRILRFVLLPIATLLFRLKVEGEENVPPSGGVILAANHVSFVDPLVLGVATRRTLNFLAKVELFRHPIFAFIIRKLNALPVGRDRMELSTFKKGLALLKRGEVLVVFPEGTRGEGGKLGEAKLGIGLLAKWSGVPVVPVYHRGAEKVLPKGAFLPRVYPLRVFFGRPLRFSTDALKGEEGLVEFSRQVMEEITSLKATWEEREGSQKTRQGGTIEDEFHATTRRGVEHQAR